MGSPGSLVEFIEAFPDEEACRRTLYRHRWPNGFVCPRCGGGHAYPIKKRVTFECASCCHQTSLTAGTIFHRSGTPLLKWFLAIHLLSTTTKAMSAEELRRQLGVARQTAWTIRRKIVSAMITEDAQLTGLVEMDESYVGGRNPSNAGRGNWTKSSVAVMAERTDGGGLGSVAMSVIFDASAQSLLPAARSAIAPGSTVLTDGWAGYSGFDEYDHRPEKIGDPKRAGELLPWVHTVVSNFKRWILDIFHGVSAKHLQAYLDEYCYRLNRRYARHDLFRRLLNRCCLYFGPVTYKELTES